MSFINENETIVGVEFNNIQMTFTVSRDLPLVDNIRWFRYTQRDSNRLEILEEERYMFSEDRLTLTIQSLNLSDSGIYTMEASNIVGTGNASVTLDVQSKYTLCTHHECL